MPGDRAGVALKIISTFGNRDDAAFGVSFGDHHQARCRPGEILLHKIEAPKRIAAMRNKTQFKHYHDIPLARNPSFVSWYARQKCFCADRRSYQNVSRETLLSDWSIIPDKLDHSPISLDNIMAEGASAYIKSLIVRRRPLNHL